MHSVTEVLDYLVEPELVSWMERTSKAKRKQITDEAKKVGNIVNRLIDLELAGTPQDIPSDTRIKNCMLGWESFKRDYPSFILSVTTTQEEISDGEIVGHPDFTHLNGITDLKCAKSIWPKHWTQTAKYYRMKHGQNDGFIAILRLDKETGNYEYKKFEDQEYIDYEIEVFDAYFTAFRHAMTNREAIRQYLENLKA